MTGHVDNAAWTGAAPLISVLVPFHRDDPSPLLAALERHRGPGVEIVLLDDGSADPALTARIEGQVRDMAIPARLVTLRANEGRARGRNRLAAQARGGWLLFLDSDMLPDEPGFLATYLALVERSSPAVVFGGFSLRQADASRANALHRALASKSDCAPASQRRLRPEKYVFTSNLLVRRDVFESERFDEGFAGWGWEDVEWAMRVARRHAIEHIDNTATHLGLEPAATLAAKYEQSAANFARVVNTHLDVVQAYPSYRAARVLRLMPLRRLWRPLLKVAALADALPVRLRAFSLRLYRAALYAEAV